MDIFEEIWHGNLSPHEFNHIENNLHYNDAISSVNASRQRLAKDFTLEQKDLLEHYSTSMDELSTQTELDAFKSGFKLATRLLIAAVS